MPDRLLLLARGEYAAAGRADEGAGILMAEVVQLDLLRVLAGPRGVAEVVVVVDDRARYFAGIDRLHGDAVAAIWLHVLLHAAQEGERRVGALEREHGTDDGLEISAGRGGGPAAFPGWLGQIHHRGRQLRLGQLARIIGQHRAARRDPDPFAAARHEAGLDQGEGCGVDGREQPGVLDQRDGGANSR